MSFDVSQLLHDAAGDPKEQNFDAVWRRSRQLHGRRTAVVTGALVSGMLTVVFLMSVLPLEEWSAPPSSTNRVPLAEGAWQAIPEAPIEGRINALSAWTGSELIVWGGYDPRQGYNSPTRKRCRCWLNGAAFNPSTDEWQRLAQSPITEAADVGRSAVWTGEEFIIWGGAGARLTQPDNGAAYNPATDSWRTLPGAPTWSLGGHSAVWTGDEMIVWGGDVDDGGAAYDPRSNRWRAIAYNYSDPPQSRSKHAAVWTGEEMIVWGGSATSDGDALSDGGAYDPRQDTWRTLPEAPISSRDYPDAVWTGREMIVWGGISQHKGQSTGAAYDPEQDSWRTIEPAPITDGLDSHHPAWTGSAFPASMTKPVWTGSVMVVLGHNRGAAYDPRSDSWTELPASPALQRDFQTMVWSGGELLVWGGDNVDASRSNADGARWRPE